MVQATKQCTRKIAKIASKGTILRLVIQKFGKDTLKYLPSKIIPAFAGLLVIPIITRLFEPNDYGNYVLVMATVGLLSIVPGSLLGTATVRFFPAYKRQSRVGSFYKTLITGSIGCVAVIGVVFLSLLRLAKSAISLELYYLMSIGILLFVVTSIFTILLHLLNAREKASLYTYFSIWQVGAGFAFGIAIVLALKLGVEGLLWGSIGAFLVALRFLWRSAFEGAPQGGAFSKSIAIKMAKHGGPLIFGSLAAWMMSFSDRYIIGLYRGSSEVGLYSVSYVIGERPLIMLWTLFMLSSYPLIVKTWENQGKQATQEFVGKLTRYYLLIGFPAALGLSVLSKSIIGGVTATAYYEGYRIVPLVAFGAFLLGLQWWTQVGLLLYKQTNTVMYTVFAAGLLNIGLNFLLISKYGYTAAAATTFISYAFLLVLMVFVSRRFLVWEFPFKSLAKTVCASAIMAIVVYYIGNSFTSSLVIKLTLGISLGALIYFLVLFLLQEFKPSEVQVLKIT